MEILSLFGWLWGCAGVDADDEGGRADDTAAEPLAGMYVAPDRSHCDYDSTYDVNADGTDDGTVHQEYGALGLMTRYSSAYPELGESFEITREFDALGCATYENYEHVNADYRNAYTMTCACDGFGQPTACDFIREQDGYAYSYRYGNQYEGEENRLARQVTEYWFDGVFLMSHQDSFEYDDAGRVARKLTESDTEPVSLLEQEWQADDRLKTESFAYFDEEDGFTSYWQSTFDEHDRYLVWTYTRNPKNNDEYRYSQTWYDEIYETSSTRLDDDNDGADDIAYSYDCTLEWPWRCDVSQDGSLDAEDPRALDGTVDHAFQFAWSCK